ncbi:hypothetical protein C5167_040235 [Papaver somniferum]|uniref:Uncharacterized protein n=1 Tax=Papaver somniferum TaxID=3469 RepID=A0A4Y7IEC6_PAPSO|nr:hypothetical protein C5167_040235 [Papaver somniferum]
MLKFKRNQEEEMMEGMSLLMVEIEELWRMIEFDSEMKKELRLGFAAESENEEKSNNSIQRWRREISGIKDMGCVRFSEQRP